MFTTYDYVMVPVQVFILLVSIYYIIISLFGFYNRKEKDVFAPQSNFAIVVAAHNEEQVIGALVENLQVLEYPKELYDIHVIADNCTDNTALICKNLGAFVHERENKVEKGKGFALEWMFERIFKMPKKYDAIVIFDADNLVHPKFLLEMNNRLCKGEKVIQGYLDCKNPDDTWVSATFSICFWVVDHVWHLAKYNIGLSSVLGGTGMCIATEILQKHGWGATCLTEDMEFTMKALLQGVPTTWAHNAIVYDEKPLTFKQSWNQRKRWAQGHFDVAGRYVPKLFVSGIKQGNIKMLDGIVHLLQPYLLIISTVFLFCNMINVKYPFYTNIFIQYIPLEFLIVVAVWQYAMPMLILAKVHASMKTWFYFLFYPLFIYSWIPITILGFIDRNKREWSHTVHTRSISYQDMLMNEEFSNPKQIIMGKNIIK